MWGLGFVVVHTRYFGRALEWHSRGQRFDPAYLHQNDKPQGQMTLWFFLIHEIGHLIMFSLISTDDTSAHLNPIKIF